MSLNLLKLQIFQMHQSPLQATRKWIELKPLMDSPIASFRMNFINENYHLEVSPSRFILPKKESVTLTISLRCLSVTSDVFVSSISFIGRNIKGYSRVKESRYFIFCRVLPPASEALQGSEDGWPLPLLYCLLSLRNSCKKYELGVHLYQDPGFICPSGNSSKVFQEFSSFDTTWNVSNTCLHLIYWHIRLISFTLSTHTHTHTHTHTQELYISHQTHAQRDPSRK